MGLGLSVSGCKIAVLEGDIVNVAAHCEVIVNATAGGDLLSGGPLCNSITKAAGTPYINYVKLRYPAGLQNVLMGKCTAGNLGCKYIYLISSPSWNPTTGEKFLADQIVACLTQLNVDGCTSIAFPAIGTGGLKYPACTVAKVMFDSTIHWLRFNPYCKVKSVNFVVFSTDIATYFDNEYTRFHKKYMRSQTVYSYPKSLTGKDRKFLLFQTPLLNPHNTIKDVSGMVEKSKTNVEEKIDDIYIDKLELIPKEWNWNGKYLDDYSLVQLDPNSAEYNKVVDAAVVTQQVNILKIERVQNPVKHQQYIVLKQKMQQTLLNGFIVERYLYHGTAAENIPGICSIGFNRSLAGQNGTAFGNGSYFARDFRYSTDYGNTVFQAKVLTGVFTQGIPSMRVAPDLDASKGTKYDSVVDNVANPSIFVVFSDNHAYPEYLITFG